MNVLVINCGSSSLKYQVIDSGTEDVLAKGLCERIGIDGRLVYEPAGGRLPERICRHINRRFRWLSTH